jgi:molecular chaperone GrpE
VFNPWKDRQAEDETENDPTAEAAADLEVEEDLEESREEDTETGDPVADELAEMKDRHLRLAAEFENFRKRTRKEHAESRTVAQADLARQILPTLDDLARVADTPHESTTVEDLDKGIELILRNLRKQLEDAGLTRIEALDEKFNPEIHQAIMTSDVGDPELDETVSRVFVDGYEFLGRLVRAAQVEVRNFVDESESDE